MTFGKSVNRLNRSATVSLIVINHLQTTQSRITLFYSEMSYHKLPSTLKTSIKTFNCNYFLLHLPKTSIPIQKIQSIQKVTCIDTVFNHQIVTTFKTLTSIVSQTLQSCFVRLKYSLRDNHRCKLSAIESFSLKYFMYFPMTKNLLISKKSQYILGMCNTKDTILGKPCMASINLLFSQS